MSIEQCRRCEYRNYCFWPLRFLKAVTNGPCRQYRKMKEYKVKNESPGTNNTVASVQSVFSRNTDTKIG